MECNLLKCDILAYRCDACDAAPGRRHRKNATIKAKHKVKATIKAKRMLKSTLKTVTPPSLPTAAPVTPATAPAAVESSNPLTEHLDFEFSTITDDIDSTVAITESLTRFFLYASKNPSDY